MTSRISPASPASSWALEKGLISCMAILKYKKKGADYASVYYREDASEEKLPEYRQMVQEVRLILMICLEECIPERKIGKLSKRS